uniref:Uncharacterized protein n=1 Tax=Aegilops tauschii subsp. strangulata TaxID=200361 RepID=A0A453MUD7_AEGTS
MCISDYILLVRGLNVHPETSLSETTTLKLQILCNCQSLLINNSRLLFQRERRKTS